MDGNILQNEKELLLLASVNDRHAFSRLYKHFLNPLYCYIFPFLQCKEDTEEIIQEVFVAIWLNRQKLGGIASFKHYVFRIARNKLLNFIRDRKVQRKHLEAIAASGSQMADPYQRLQYLESYSMARAAIDKLPLKRKRIFLLSTEDGLSLNEISHLLQISKSVVKKQLYAATAFVRNYISKNTSLSWFLFSLTGFFDFIFKK